MDGTITIIKKDSGIFINYDSFPLHEILGLLEMGKLLIVKSVNDNKEGEFEKEPEKPLASVTSLVNKDLLDKGGKNEQ